MQVAILDTSYNFSKTILSQKNTRDGYFQLANTIYGLNFDLWYRSGYWDNKYIPYVLYDGNIGVSSVAVCINDVKWQYTEKRYLQISTVMTLPEYRNKGLSRWLMEFVLNEWKDNCDAIYLLANDSVIDYYPKFGFEEYTEYDFTIPIEKRSGNYRKLNLDCTVDFDLLVNKYKLSNPFTDLKVTNLSQFIFHCLHFQSDNIYYIEQYDAIVIASHKNNIMTCYDIFMTCGNRLNDVLGILATEKTEYVILGFTPQIITNYQIVESKEEDNHLFVLSGKENIFKDNKIMFPLLSRA